MGPGGHHTRSVSRPSGQRQTVHGRCRHLRPLLPYLLSKGPNVPRWKDDGSNTDSVCCSRFGYTNASPRPPTAFLAEARGASGAAVAEAAACVRAAMCCAAAQGVGHATDACHEYSRNHRRASYRTVRKRINTHQRHQCRPCVPETTIAAPTMGMLPRHLHILCLCPRVGVFHNWVSQTATHKQSPTLNCVCPEVLC